MRNKRFLLVGSVVSLALAPAVTWAAPEGDPGAVESESGGAVATPLIHGPGGGVLAPASQAAAEAAQAEETPEAVGGAEPTPTAPEGEQQPGSESQEDSQPAAGERSAGSADATAASGAPESGGGDSLPVTGMGLAALTAVGLGLLIAGLAVHPRRRTKA